jgi:hypothetical protein
MIHNGFFGNTLTNRLEPAAGSKKDPVYSNTTEEFYQNVYQAVVKEGPTVYVQDSMDALTTKDEIQKFKASGKGREVSGSYGMQKAKDNRRLLRIVHNKLRGTPSILVVTGQSQVNLGFTGKAESKTHAGGAGLDFYASVVLVSKIKGHIYTGTGKDKLEQGIVCQVTVKKNRETGRVRTVDIPIYHSYGIDVVGGCIDYLVSVGHWKASGDKEGTWSLLPKGKIDAKEFGQNATRERLVGHIEHSGAEQHLRELVARVWNEREESIKVERLPRYV